MPHSAPRPSAGAEDFMPIEADLEAFSPGRVAGGDCRRAYSRLAEGDRALFSTFMYCSRPDDSCNIMPIAPTRNAEFVFTFVY